MAKTSITLPTTSWNIWVERIFNITVSLLILLKFFEWQLPTSKLLNVLGRNNKMLMFFILFFTFLPVLSPLSYGGRVICCNFFILLMNLGSIILSRKFLNYMIIKFLTIISIMRDSHDDLYISVWVKLIHILAVI